MIDLATNDAPVAILRIDSSGRRTGSVTRELTDALVGKLSAAQTGAV